jgi:hypothetical protein
LTRDSRWRNSGLRLAFGADKGGGDFAVVTAGKILDLDFSIGQLGRQQSHSR